MTIVIEDYQNMMIISISNIYYVNSIAHSIMIMLCMSVVQSIYSFIHIRAKRWLLDDKIKIIQNVEIHILFEPITDDIGYHSDSREHSTQLSLPIASAVYSSIGDLLPTQIQRTWLRVTVRGGQGQTYDG